MGTLTDWLTDWLTGTKFLLQIVRKLCLKVPCISSNPCSLIAARHMSFFWPRHCHPVIKLRFNSISPSVYRLFQLLFPSSFPTWGSYRGSDRSWFFLYVTQHRLVVRDRRFGTTSRSHFRIFLDCLSIGDRADRFSRNVAKQLAIYAVYHFRRGGVSLLAVSVSHIHSICVVYLVLLDFITVLMHVYFVHEDC